MADDRQRGQVLVEVVDDHVAAHTLGSSTTAMSWRQVEVELGGHGDLELLDRVERRLLEAGVRRRTRAQRRPLTSVSE